MYFEELVGNALKCQSTLLQKEKRSLLHDFSINNSSFDKVERVYGPMAICVMANVEVIFKFWTRRMLKPLLILTN
jgi:hypothetical protein